MSFSLFRGRKAKSASAEVSSGKTIVLRRAELDGGRKLCVVLGDLTKESVDVIVNAANEALKHGSGLAGALVRIGGRSILRESRAWVSEHGKLEAGGVAVTGAGHLPASYIVHAVGPRWGGGAAGEEVLLGMAVTAALEAASERSCTSIAMPAIATGVFGFPLDAAVRIILSAVREYFTTTASSSLRVVRFTNWDRTTADAAAAAFDALFPAFAGAVPAEESGGGGGGGGGGGSSDESKAAGDEAAPSSGFFVPVSSEEEIAADEDCVICMCPLRDEDDEDGDAVVALRRCGHRFHAACIARAFDFKAQCPVCMCIYGVLTGDMPDGTMKTSCSSSPRLSGFSCKTITIRYHFPSGVQSDMHPSPGERYSGTSRTAYLPDNAEGRRVLALLEKAFERKLTFTIGTSVTTGRRNCVVWNGVHHKTNTSGGATRFGYPDDSYFVRVTEELAAKGVFDDE